MCFHGEGRETRQFHRIMEALSPEFRVVAFDMPAHGKSWPVDGKRPISDWNAYVDFAWQFLQTMELEDAILMGCGLGAAVVFALAQAHEVKGVISVSGTADSTAEIDYDLIDHPHISTPHMVLEYNRSVTGTAADEQARQLILWQAWGETAVTFKADIRMLCAIDMTGNMGQISCPALMFKGMDDWTITDEMAEKTFAATGSAKKEFVALADTGRFAMVEQPEQMAETIKTFFAE